MIKRLPLFLFVALLLLGAGCSAKKTTSPATNINTDQPDLKKVCLYHLDNNSVGNLYRCSLSGSDVYVSSIEYNDVYEMVDLNGKSYALCGGADPSSKVADQKKCIGHPFQEKATCAVITDRCQPYLGM